MTAEWQRDIDRLDDAIRRHAGVPDTTCWFYHGPDEHSPIEHMWRPGHPAVTGFHVLDPHVPGQYGPIARMILENAQRDQERRQYLALRLRWQTGQDLAAGETARYLALERQFNPPPAPGPETCSGCGLPADHQLNMFSGDGLKGPASQRLCAYCDMLRIEPDHSPQDPAPRATARGYVRGFRLLAGLTVFVLAFSGIIPEPWVLSAAFIAFGPPWSKRPEGT